MEVQTRVPESDLALDRPALARRQRLYRALANPDTLDEFLVNPEEVAQRFEVTLSEQELAAVRNIGHFASEWELLCGGERWLEAVPPRDQRTFSRLPSATIEEVLARAVRARIVEDILQGIPEVMRQVTQRYGADAVIEQDQDISAFPPSVQPVIQALRGIARVVNREIQREITDLVVRETVGRYPVPAYPQPAAFSYPFNGLPQPAPAPDPQVQPQTIAGLGRYVAAVVDRAVEEALERVRTIPPERRTPSNVPPPVERITA
ncbi:MAG TPA: hypothetical protein VKZ58_10305 [Longimicrobiales bacterium]|nr:hypothetical protein [Longimicrobiales bacterium]